MRLGLHLLRLPDGSEPRQPPHAIDAAGLTVGRAADCDVVLDDALRLVSRHHARLLPQGPDAVLLRCTSSTAALSVNGETVAPGSERLLHGGDRLRIGGFELGLDALPAEPTVVALELPSPATVAPLSTVPAPVPVPVLATDRVPAFTAASDPPALPMSVQRAPALRSRIDQWFDLDAVADPLGPGSPLPVLDSVATAALARKPEVGVTPGAVAVARTLFVVPLAERTALASPASTPAPAPQPANVAAPAAELAEAVPQPARPAHSKVQSIDADADADADAARAPLEPPAPAQGHAQWATARLAPDPAEQDALRLAFLRGAGLSPGRASTLPLMSAAWMEHLGALLRTATDGTLSLLRSRAVAKRSIRAEGTRILARENNLLKFVPDPADALALLLQAHSAPGFLDPVEALQDAHSDLQVHQLAMVAGMRAAVFELISRLGPRALEAEAPVPKGWARCVPVLREAALWRLHRQRHTHLLENLDDDFEAVFGREFLRAYEEQSRLAAASDPAPSGIVPTPTESAGPS